MILISQKGMNKLLMGARLTNEVGQVPRAMKRSHIPDIRYYLKYKILSTIYLSEYYKNATAGAADY
jgi:hypothetical protein